MTWFLNNFHTNPIRFDLIPFHSIMHLENFIRFWMELCVFISPIAIWCGKEKFRCLEWKSWRKMTNVEFSFRSIKQIALWLLMYMAFIDWHWHILLAKSINIHHSVLLKCAQCLSTSSSGLDGWQNQVSYFI